MTDQYKANSTRTVRIGGASGYWGDSQEAPRQLIMQGNIDYLVFDYLAEVTMSILVRAREKSPDAGYAKDFIGLVMKPLIHEIKKRKIRVVVNAGGVNIPSCAQALARVAEDAGVELKIGTVEGDDLMGKIDQFREKDIREMYSGAAIPEQMISANAYLGAFPIAAALDAGADVVITGRCVDSAVTLGPLIHEFGWGADDFDLLAAGTLAGHIIECGTQATGGNFTDWRDTVAGWDNMGYPIAECRPDGSFVITKPENTGGLISPLTVGEQILYEIGDPKAYVMPDLICDLSEAQLKQIGPDRLEVSGLKGRAPTETFKVSATYWDGFRATAISTITGFDAVEKGKSYAEALLKRTRRLFTQRDLHDYRDTAVHLIGSQTLWGKNADESAPQAREIVARIDVRHEQRDAMELFSKETTGTALSMTTGRCGAGSTGRPKITPVVAQFAFLVDKSEVTPKAFIDGEEIRISARPSSWTAPSDIDSQTAPAESDVKIPDGVDVPLISLAVARSGDKGNNANIGLIARKPEYLEWIKNSVTSDKVRQWFQHTVRGEVYRYDLPGMHAVNFVLTRCLGGGGTSSLHLDTQAKTYAQQLLAMPVSIPRSAAEKLK